MQKGKYICLKFVFRWEIFVNMGGEFIGFCGSLVGVFVVMVVNIDLLMV